MNARETGKSQNPGLFRFRFGIVGLPVFPICAIVAFVSSSTAFPSILNIVRRRTTLVARARAIPLAKAEKKEKIYEQISKTFGNRTRGTIDVGMRRQRKYEQAR